MSHWNFLVPAVSPDDFLIDCRSQAQFEQETLTGAYYFPFIKKAFGSDAESQKKMLGPMLEIQKLYSTSQKKRIVVFDEGMGMFASRMVFLLRELGIREVFMLGERWPVEGPKSKGTLVQEIPPAAKLMKLEGIIDKAFLETNLTRMQIFDTRTKDEYDGKLPRLTNPEPGTLCGRLPGAFLWDWRTLYDSEGMLIDKTTFNKRLQGFPFMPERTTVLYDYNGARSCLLALMLRELGYQDVRTYQGSWFEWRKSSLPKQAVSIYGQSGPGPAAPRVGGTDRNLK